ncbi:Breast carcinoma amplified sequence 3 [Gryganskiella cystojenkinii]|nr:Breast carcinoma amplified sequence 3 [Gryganskiella cystojenkinii]
MAELLQGTTSAGVRAEPVFIRDPSALESLSSVLTGVSSYVANTLPASFSLPAKGFASPSSPAFPPNASSSSSPYYYPATQGSGANALLGNHQDNVCVLNTGDVVQFSAFDWIETGGSSRVRSSRRFCLLLGYTDGFQIWDITHPDNVHEIVSIREGDGSVTFLKVLPTPRVPSGKVDQLEQYRPLVALIQNTKAGDSTPTSKLQIYSLTAHKIIKTVDFGEGPDYELSTLDVNERGLVVALSAPGESTRLHLLNQLTLLPLHPKQVALNDAAYPGVFALGTRLLAYVTTSDAPSDSSDSKNGDTEQESGNGYQDLAKGVAKEVFGGVKMLGGFAHQTFSSYWSGSSGANSAASTSPPVQGGFNRSPNRHSRRASATADHERSLSQVPNRRRQDEGQSHRKEAVGTIIVRDLSLANMPIVAHFKPHDHPISGCKFSPSGRLLLTVSRHGNVFHIHEVRPTIGHGARHLYKLARGITHASVEDIVFNEDETWVAVTTSRGTTHLYAINPFGGSPDVGAHMYTGVVNWTATAIEYPTSLNALCRIKQRHHVPDIILSAVHDLDHHGELHSPGPSDRRRGSLHRQNSQDSLSSAGTSASEQGHHHPSRYPHVSQTGGKQRAMIAAYFLPSTTVFATDPSHVVLSPGEYDGSVDGPFGAAGDQIGRDGGAQTSNLLIHRSKVPPVSTTARLQSTASHLWQTLSPPAAAVVQHAAHGLASLPGLVAETSRRGPVATVRSRTMSWTGAHHGHLGQAKQYTNGARDPRGELGNGSQGHGTNSQQQNVVEKTPLAVQQQLASQTTLSEPDRGPSYADMYVFNPLGMLTLHRCWVSSVRSKKTYNGRVVETSDLVLAPEDVAEWTLNRSGDWAVVKRPLPPPNTLKTTQSVKSKKNSSASVAASRWLAHAEISTYDNGMHSGWKGQYPLLNQTLAAQGPQSTTVTLTQPQHLLWKSPQFSFHTYVDPLDSIRQQFAEGVLPQTRTLNLRRGVAIVAGKDGRPATDPSMNLQGANRPWISGIAVSADGGGVRGHGRVESHEGDAEDLSENLSSAMRSYLHSGSPINQSRMSPSVGSISPSSLRAATLSFEDAYLISLGNASGSPKTGSFSTFNPSPHHTQHTFLSTPPAEQGAKSRSGSLPGSSPLNGHHVPKMTAAYAINTPSSSTAVPLVSSFGETGSSLSVNGSTKGGGGGGHRLSMQSSTGRSSPKIQQDRLVPQPQQQQSIHPMAQSTLMMFSPDGDNEVDMPGSASVFIGHGSKPRGGRSSQASLTNGNNNKPQGSMLPQGGVFHLDDDFLFEGDEMEDYDQANGEKPHSNGVLSEGRPDQILGRARHHGSNDLSSFLEQDEAIEDDYDDGSLI